MTTTAHNLRREFVFLHNTAATDEWPARQVQALHAEVITTVPLAVKDNWTLDGRYREIADTLVSRGGAHLLATGELAPSAIALAAARPDAVCSLVIGDPIGPERSPENNRLLAAVITPTLVIASAPDGDRNITPGDAQRIAGGIDNGVFVVIDRAYGPAHRERWTSFNEWASSFAGIAEGLAGLSALPQEEPHG